MAAAELAFEYFALALETTRGTAVTPPTHYAPMSGTLTPGTDFYRPEESRGTLATTYRSKAVRRSAEWTMEGGADPNYAPLLFSIAVKGGVSPTTPGGATLARLWTFTPDMTADTIKSFTAYFGDPNSQIWQSAYCMANELTISADASGTDGATMSISGFGKFPAKVSPPTLPGQTVGDLLMPGAMQVWLDTSSAIGTTELIGRVVSAELTVSNELSQKHLAAGPTSDLSFSKVGRGKRTVESSVVFELADTAQYDLYAAGTPVKMRVRINGDLIEGALYSYIEWDVFGPLDQFSWGDLEGTNRTMEFTITSQYDSTAGADFVLRTQNTKTSI